MSAPNPHADLSRQAKEISMKKQSEHQTAETAGKQPIAEATSHAQRPPCASAVARNGRGSMGST